MKAIIGAITIAVVFVAGAVLLTHNTTPSNDRGTNTNVSIVNGKQIIAIDAKGGYSPRLTIAKAGIPTVIKMNTTGTFDCSSALVIPNLKYRENLPLSGETLIDVPPQQAGTSMQGLCAMGMYNFTITFE